MVKPTTCPPDLFWDKVWFSDETIHEARETVLEALYIALKPGSLPSLCVYLFDCALTIAHFLISSYILDDFTTSFLGTVYFPCTFLKIIYIVQCFTSAQWTQVISESINQIFNMTIILSSVAYNFMCLFVAMYRKNIPLPVCRTIFGPILLFCSFLVIVPKLLFDNSLDNLFQFTTQLFGSLCLLSQIAGNLYTFVCKPSPVSKKSIKINNDDVEASNDVVRNANGRLVWASWFSLLLVLLAIPQIVDYYVPLTIAWIPWHFLIQSIAQLNALFLSTTVFLVLPTYRSVIFNRCSNYKRIIKVEEVKISGIQEISPKQLEKEAEAMANHQKIPDHVFIPKIPKIPKIPSFPHFHQVPPGVHGQIRIFVAPNQRKY